MFFVTLAPGGGEALLVGLFGRGFDVAFTVGASACVDDTFAGTTEIILATLVQFAIEHIYWHYWNYFHIIVKSRGGHEVVAELIRNTPVAHYGLTNRHCPPGLLRRGSSREDLPWIGRSRRAL